MSVNHKEHYNKDKISSLLLDQLIYFFLANMDIKFVTHYIFLYQIYCPV